MTASPQQAELDNGPQSRERERMCVLTREVRPVADLIRFVVGPDGAAVPDLKSKLPGRGVWVTATHDALAEAVKRKALVRGFKREVRLNADLVTQTGQLLEQAVLDALAMAGKAGLVANGFGKTEAALADEDKRVIGLIHATDAAPDGVRKLGAALRRRDSGDQVAVITSLTTAQLDLALGRPNVVHAALLAGPASDTFLVRLRRLERFRSGEQSV
jgi:predicted RNA-binding protein YlxR (DUF448 family)